MDSRESPKILKWLLPLNITDLTLHYLCGLNLSFETHIET